MDPDDYDLIRRLCTKAGTIMEDMSVAAIVNSGFLPEFAERTLLKLTFTAAQIVTLIAAVKAVTLFCE